MAEPFLPALIQGGMGAGVSGWRLARAVARTGQLGVVSGVALDVLLARRLQLGDPGGHLRRALGAFPVPEVAERILRRYFVPGGIAPGRPFRPVPRLGLRPSRARDELTAAANFSEVWLARQGHGGPVGINYLEKIQLATPAAVYGAMLAGVDYVLMGAGIPTQIPALLDAFAAGRTGELTVTVAGAERGRTIAFTPSELTGAAAPPARPRFLAIVSSAVLAAYLHRSPQTRPDGFVVESPVAGGHSAPPRGRLRLDEAGEPVYGPRDRVDPAKIAALGAPFWLAGGHAAPGAAAAARSSGAAGIQAGTIFALCRESGLDPRLRRRLLQAALTGGLRVRNDPDASPAGFPFKVAELPGTLSEAEVYRDRPRLCDLGYLRTPYVRANGAVGFRCPAEPVDDYIRKGGAAEDTAGRRCLCNGLVAGIGLAQHRPDGYTEPPLLTLGQDLGFLPDLLDGPGGDYTAADAVDYLLNR
ncbi:2-nitropropane dioxygenase [Actinomadura sp. NBRC 104425]|uniref:nitronate monooxygenase n=1 Tax=Actinomadura sp. NBRC 104425 TaxID=3032204 RepID=UPI0024A2FCAB|nr:nitronate monooxygenase [Actinomadura sp. NBRC 104425]GLZ11498.1 2-nitropropane dioxygenase [Actinomadura sp. NBRC 104425]